MREITVRWVLGKNDTLLRTTQPLRAGYNPNTHILYVGTGTFDIVHAFINIMGPRQPPYLHYPFKQEEIDHYTPLLLDMVRLRLELVKGETE